MLHTIAKPDGFTLSRFRPYEYKQYRKIYKNRGFRYDAERFSLIDSVLDGEYNDALPFEETAEIKMKERRSKIVRLFTGGLFRIVLYSRLATYYVLHVRYRSV